LVFGAASGAILYNLIGLWSLLLPVSVLFVILCIVRLRKPEFIS
jgi:uncharacterized membrane protein YoaK (UPF0700 family)